MAVTLTLDDRLDLRHSVDLAAALQDLRGQDVRLDGRDLHYLGGHAAQTLLVAATTWRADGHAFILDNLSARARECLARLDLDPLDLGADAGQAA